MVRIENSTGTGSGAIFETQGQTAYIITNQHVVDGDAEVSVIVNDLAYYRGTVLGTDTDRDLAVVRICCGSFSKLFFGDASRLQPGDEVVTIGYALGLPGEATITRGIVSAIRYHPGYRSEVIQTDAAVNFGNSGGPTLSMSGDILGINTFGPRDSEGLNFAVSGTMVQQRIPALMTAQAVPTPTPMPPPTPTPVYTGDWTYFGPDCPSAYFNCAGFSSPNPFISLGAFRSNASRPPHHLTSIHVSCVDRGVRVHFIPREWEYYGDDYVGVGTQVGYDEEPTVLIADYTSAVGVTLGYTNSATVVLQLWEAERTLQPFIIWTLDRFRNHLRGQFNTAGFTANYWRLPCAE